MQRKDGDADNGCDYTSALKQVATELNRWMGFNANRVFQQQQNPLFGAGDFIPIFEIKCSASFPVDPGPPIIHSISGKTENNPFIIREDGESADKAANNRTWIVLIICIS